MLQRHAPAAVFLALLSLTGVQKGADRAEVVVRAPLRDPPPLGKVLEAAAAVRGADDRGLSLGSIFSGLAPDPESGALSFWGLSDRGPNSIVEVGGEERRALAVPGYPPSLVRVRVSSGQGAPVLAVGEVLALRGTDGKPLSGVPNRGQGEEKPYDVRGETALEPDVNGVDTEALVRTRSGEFWIGEEYGPSLLHVASDGRVLARYVPVGSNIQGARVPVKETLPAVYTRRASNRGFEALAISADEKQLYAFVQSPLANPDKATGKASRIARVLVVDPTNGQPIAEHALVTEPASVFRETKQSEVKLGDAVWAAPAQFLVVERTDARARLEWIDLTGATQLLGTPWASADTVPSLESLSPDALAANGITPVAKRLACDLSELVPDLPTKIEGLALIDAHTIAIGNDNEYNVAGYGPDGRMKPGSALSELLVIRLPAPR